jgi:hypothetical protein
MTRKYNTIFRENLKDKLLKFNNKDDFINIYFIIYEDINNNYSSNSNGIFINMNNLSNSCIEKLINYYDKNYKKINNNKINYSEYNSDENPSETFNNQEKKIIKKIKNKL